MYISLIFSVKYLLDGVAAWKHRQKISAAFLHCTCRFTHFSRDEVTAPALGQMPYEIIDRLECSCRKRDTGAASLATLTEWEVEAGVDGLTPSVWMWSSPFSKNSQGRQDCPSSQATQTPAEIKLSDSTVFRR